MLVSRKNTYTMLVRLETCVTTVENSVEAPQESAN